MRKFLIEMQSEITIEKLMRDYERGASDTDAETFAQYLENCMARNNGALTEILTEDTPRGELNSAVTLCRVQYSEDEDDYCEEWLTPQEIAKKWRDGCGIKYLDR